MRSASVYAILAAVAAPLVSGAAINIRQVQDNTSRPAPYEGLTEEQHKILGLNATGWGGSDKNTDDYRCHATCGFAIQIGRKHDCKKRCELVEFLNYCMNCTKSVSWPIYPGTKLAGENCGYTVIKGGKIEERGCAKIDQSQPEPTGEKDSSSQTKQAQPASDGSATSGTASQSEGDASKAPTASTTQTGAASAAVTHGDGKANADPNAQLPDC